MAEKVVYAKTSATLAHGGLRIPIRAGEPWDAADPLVAAYSDMFADDLAMVRSTSDPRGYSEVERATRAPGEKRNVKRPRTSDGAGKTGE